MCDFAFVNSFISALILDVTFNKITFEKDVAKLFCSVALRHGVVG